MRTRKLTVAVGAVAAGLVALHPGVAGAGATRPDHAARHFEAALRPVAHDPAADAGSDASGHASLLLRQGEVLKAKIAVSGLSALPHVMHIHGAAEAENECPGPDRRDDRVDDGLIDTVEGLADYGPILVSFTTSGDTSAASGLDLARFPVAGNDGAFRYKRTFAIPTEVAEDLEDLHIVVHGHDLNGNGVYDGPDGSLGAGIPLEAELPVACGEIDRR